MEIEKLIAKVDELGGAVAGVEAGFQKSEIEKNAYRISQEIESKERIVVGVNEFTSPPEPYKPLRVDESVAKEQSENLAKLRAERDNTALQIALDTVQATARRSENLMPAIKAALVADGTIGEISTALRSVWGSYRAPESW
jgi:methylmalonyl-CoA mutase N-terminal domain/subunit